MAQGTTSQAAWSIAQGGFGIIASENDQGWFGKGFSILSFFSFFLLVHNLLNNFLQP